MKKVFFLILFFLIGIFCFGLYKHNFDITKYLTYVSTEWITNFVADFDPTNPNTRLRFLYPVNEETDHIDPLDAELAKLIESTSWEALSWSQMEWKLSWENLPSTNTWQENILSLSWTTTWLTQNTQTWENTFDDFEAFFNEHVDDSNSEQNGLNNEQTINIWLWSWNETNTSSIDTISLVQQTKTWTIHEQKDQKQSLWTWETWDNKKQITSWNTWETTTNIQIITTKQQTWSKIETNKKENYLLSWNLSGTTNTGNNIYGTGFRNKTGTTYETQLSPLLQKRLEQYREFKKTLKK